MSVFDRATGTFVNAVKMQLAAAVANKGRNERFWAKVGGSYSGPRVLAEGDSWFCYPSELVLGAPEDIITQLGREFAVATQAVPGDLVAMMRDTLFSTGGLLTGLKQFKADVLLLSGGGNDLLGDGALERTLAPGPRPLADYFKREAFADSFWGVLDDLEFVLREALKANPGLKAVIHGYDYAIATGKGPWLRAPMLRLGIPQSQHQAVIDRIVDWFNRAQIEMAAKINADFGEPRVFQANLRDAALTAQWYDEIHPSTAGFKTITTRIRTAVLKAHPLVA